MDDAPAPPPVAPTADDAPGIAGGLDGRSPGAGGDPEEPRNGSRGTTPALEISGAVVRLMKEHYGKGPTSVRTHLLGDAVVVLTYGGFTRVEHTLNELGHEDAVIDQRQAFKEAMGDRFRTVVADALGRDVVAVLSATHVDPDIACETFVLAPRAA